MKKLTCFKKGDVIDIIAPASFCHEKKFKRGLKVLEKWGLHPRLPKDLFGKDFLCSNTKEKRFEHFKKAVESRKSQGIWCVRGGYGSLQLVSFLEKMKKPRHKKIFIGYSDMTVLHLLLNQKWNWASLHGPVIEDLEKNTSPLAIRHLKKILFQPGYSFNFSNLRPLNEKATRVSSVKGLALGGNLCLTCSCLGSFLQINSTNKILIFEDIGEQLYKIDRYLYQLKNAKAFNKAKAVIFGDFVLSKKDQVLFIKILKDFCKGLKCPVFIGLPIGHIESQKALWLGHNYRIQKGKNSRFILKASPLL